MLTRRGFLATACATCCEFLDTSLTWARPEQRDVNKAIRAAATKNLVAQIKEASQYQSSAPVGFDRIWLKRTTGEEIVAVYRDYRFALAVVPQQCLNLSYFWRDVKDNNTAVSVTLALFDVLSRVQTSLSTLSGKAVPIVLTSGYRTQRHNATIEGAATTSEHLYARAADIVVQDFKPAAVAQAGHMLGAGGIGLYSEFTHIDVGRPGRRWKG